MLARVAPKLRLRRREELGDEEGEGEVRQERGGGGNGERPGGHCEVLKIFNNAIKFQELISISIMCFYRLLEYLY